RIAPRRKNARDGRFQASVECHGMFRLECVVAEWLETLGNESLCLKLIHGVRDAMRPENAIAHRRIGEVHIKLLEGRSLEAFARRGTYRQPRQGSDHAHDTGAEGGGVITMSIHACARLQVQG